MLVLSAKFDRRNVLDAQIERIVIMKRGFRFLIPFIRQVFFDEWLILIRRLIREPLASGIDAEADDLRAFRDEIFIEDLDSTVCPGAGDTQD